MILNFRSKVIHHPGEISSSYLPAIIENINNVSFEEKSSSSLSSSTSHSNLSKDVKSAMARTTDRNEDNTDIDTKFSHLPPMPSSLEKYVKWHFSMSACIKNNSCSPNMLVWRCRHGLAHTCNGVGDRFRGIQFSLLLAMVTNRYFLVDWPSDPFNFEKAVAPTYIDWRIQGNLSFSGWPILHHPKYNQNIIAWDTCPESMKCSRNPKNNLNSSPNWSLAKEDMKQALSIAGNIVIYTTMFSTQILRTNSKSMIKLNDLQSEHIATRDLERILLTSLFQPSNAVAHYMKRIIPENIMEQGGYVSLHIRTGYDFQERDTSVSRFAGLRTREETIAERVLNCSIKKKGLKQGDWIFLASDSVRFKDSFSQLCRKRKYKLMYSKFPGLHVGLPHNTISSSNSNQAWLSFVNVFVEFFGLAGGKIVISNGSYFSRMAFVFGNATSHIALRPKQASCV